MDVNQRKEQFSNAYVRAVASVAGYALYKPDVDDDSIDWGIADRGGRGTLRSPKVELQLKCSGRDILTDEDLRFPLKVKNYNELRHENYQVPRILVVVLVPGRIEEWLKHSEESLAMHHCGYWRSLRGRPDTDNASTVTVRVPRSQQFTVESLTSIMDRIREGGLP
jgi:hypothetical protein